MKIIRESQARHEFYASYTKDLGVAPPVQRQAFVLQEASFTEQVKILRFRSTNSKGIDAEPLKANRKPSTRVCNVTSAVDPV